jgi:LytTr DNA-binding domain-containing protein
MTDVKNAPDDGGVEPVWDQNRTAWDELRSPGISGWFRGISGTDRRLYLAVAAVSLAIGLVNALSAAQDSAWRGGAYDLRTPLFWEMSSIATIILVAPVLFVGVRRVRHASTWPLRLALAAAAIIVFSALHIAGMVGIRKFVMWLAGGSYDFHFSAATLIYEFRKDVVTCLLIGGTLWLIDSRRETQAVATAAPGAATEPVPHLVWLRDGSTRIRIEPKEIIWISSAGNYVEYSLADGRNHLVRGTLAAAESQLARYNLARVHRTRLVNLDRVKAVELKPSGDFELTFDTGQTVAGSRRYKNAIASLERVTASS